MSYISDLSNPAAMDNRRATGEEESRTGCSKEMAYRADLTAGSLKVPESRIIADLLIRRASDQQWRKRIYDQNALQARSPATAKRLVRLIRDRLETMDSDLWLMVRDGAAVLATHAALAAAVKHSQLLGDFLDLVVREQYRAFKPALSNKTWDDYLADCRGRDSEMPQWHETTRRRLRSSVFQILAQAGYIENTRTLKLQPVHVAPQVIRYLRSRHEEHVLRCIQVGP